ncbi:hypothetical protein J6590_000164 [Homalodisca vitripennis]|nr:hypothetical protein J6590_000164 [Homalodisca vitripennis]
MGDTGSSSKRSVKRCFKVILNQERTVAIAGSLSGHPSKQQPCSTLLDTVILR